MNDPIHERGHALEELFFHQKDEQLIEQMKKRMDAEQDRKAITQVTGINDIEVLDRLLEFQIRAETLACFSLVPLVMVAWADGNVAESERTAILSAAKESGLSHENGSYQLLETWLKTEPDDELLSAWKGYVKSLKKVVTENDFAHLKSQVLGRALDVAKAAGGFLGLGNKVSKEERGVLDELEAAFA